VAVQDGMSTARTGEILGDASPVGGPDQDETSGMGDAPWFDASFAVEGRLFAQIEVFDRRGPHASVDSARGRVRYLPSPLSAYKRAGTDSGAGMCMVSSLKDPSEPWVVVLIYCSCQKACCPERCRHQLRTSQLP
jgi:hypothetical protein